MRSMFGAQGLSIPSHDVAQKECLHYFLEEYRLLLTDKSKMNFAECLEELYNIYQQLHEQYLCVNDSDTKEKRVASTLPVVCMYIALSSIKH